MCAQRANVEGGVWSVEGGVWIVRQKGYCGLWSVVFLFVRDEGVRFAGTAPLSHLPPRPHAGVALGHQKYRNNA